MFRISLLLAAYVLWLPGPWMLADEYPAPTHTALPTMPTNARLVLAEDWADGRIDPERWYTPRKQWGGGNHGVVPENVAIGTDQVRGRRQNVLLCTAHGDEYDGPIVGLGGNPTRVGGVIVSKAHFGSGRFQIVMKIGASEAHPGGPKDPRRPAGAVPALWTYAYRFVEAPRAMIHGFVSSTPMYNPHIAAYDGPFNEYWSELDFPEFGKNGDFTRAMYNTFCQGRHEPKLYPVSSADGHYHTYVTEWRTMLKRLPEVTDRQVVEYAGYWWVQDKAIPFESYLGNPLERLGDNQYAVHWGTEADHWIDGTKVAENRQFVPAMAAQLNMGIWLPQWAGPAPWKTASMSIASVHVWQYGDPGDVWGILTGDLADSFDEQGRSLR